MANREPRSIARARSRERSLARLRARSWARVLFDCGAQRDEVFAALCDPAGLGLRELDAQRAVEFVGAAIRLMNARRRLYLVS